MYKVDALSVGVNFLAMRTVVTLLVIDVSVLSINPVTFECLYIPSNCSRLLSLKFCRVFMTEVFNESEVSVVALESYLNVEFKIKKVIAGSTMTGVVEATVNGAKSLTSCVFSLVVKLSPVLDLIDIKTLPYSGVDTTPRLVSNDPLSPPNTCTA